MAIVPAMATPGAISLQGVDRATGPEMENLKKNSQVSRSTRNNRQAKNAGNGAKFCVYFNDGYCRRFKSHNSGGVFYKHACENCSGNHAAVNSPTPQAKKK